MALKRASHSVYRTSWGVTWHLLLSRVRMSARRTTLTDFYCAQTKSNNFLWDQVYFQGQPSSCGHNLKRRSFESLPVFWLPPLNKIGAPNSDSILSTAGQKRYKWAFPRRCHPQIAASEVRRRRHRARWTPQATRSSPLCRGWRRLRKTKTSLLFGRVIWLWAVPCICLHSLLFLFETTGGNVVWILRVFNITHRILGLRCLDPDSGTLQRILDLLGPNLTNFLTFCEPLCFL